MYKGSLFPFSQLFRNHHPSRNKHTQGPRLLDLLPTPPAPGGAEASLPNPRLGVAMPIAPLLLALPLLSAIAANAASLSIGVFKPSGMNGREAGVEQEIVMGVLRWWGGALTVREEGKGVRGGCKREGREFSLSEEEASSVPSLKFMGIRSGGLEVVGGGG